MLTSRSCALFVASDPLSLPSLKAIIHHVDSRGDNPVFFYPGTGTPKGLHRPFTDIHQLEEIFLVANFPVYKDGLNDWDDYFLEYILVDLGALARAHNVQRLILRNLVQKGDKTFVDELEADLQVARRVLTEFANAHVGELPKGCVFVVEYDLQC